MGASSSRLRVVGGSDSAPSLFGPDDLATPEVLDEAAAVKAVFDHWVFMMGKVPARCALGPKRRAVIRTALGLYELDVLKMAVEGCAASPWHAGENTDAKAYRDIELILRDEAHIERFADDGATLRERTQQMMEHEALRAAREASTPAVTAETLADVALNKQRVLEMTRQMARKLSGGR